MRHIKVLNGEDFPDLSWFQGPQILQTQNGYRLYFSTRSIEDDNYFFSNVAFVDYDSNFEIIKDSLSLEVISRSDAGTFDQDGIFPFHVMRTSESRVIGFICGWKRKVSVDIDMAIGISESFNDGVTFSRLGPGPILSANLKEPFLLGDPFVTHDNQGVYHMYYISGQKWVQSAEGSNERKYLIMHAYSENLLDWSRDSLPIISNRIPDEAQAMPTVIEVSGVFHMFYAFRNVFDFRSNVKNSYKIAHAYSKSHSGPWILSDWKFPKEHIEDWNSEMQCYPHAFVQDQKVHLLYNGDRFGRDAIGMLIFSEEELSDYAKF